MPETKDLLNDKDYLLEIFKKSFEDIVSDILKKKIEKDNSDNTDLINWLYLKLSVIIKNQFKGRIEIAKKERIEWIITTRTYDLVFKDKIKNKNLLIMSFNFLHNNINNNFYSTYKDIIFNNFNVSEKNTPYYSIVISPLKNLQNNWKTEQFTIKNLWKVYRWNVNNKTNSLTKIILLERKDDDLYHPISDSSVLTKKNKISAILNKDVLILDIKDLMSNIINIVGSQV